MKKQRVSDLSDQSTQTSFLLKCLERIVDHHIRDVHLANVSLHVNQHAYQSGKSTVTLLHKGCLRYQEGIYVLYIEGAFDNVPFDAILEAARSHGISPMITNWIHQMHKTDISSSSSLTLRQSAIRKLSVCGCPKGGVLNAIVATQQ